MRLPPFIVFLLVSCLCLAQDPIRPYPLPDSYLSTTSLLDHESYLEGIDDPQWYLDNIPFVDFPDKSIQDVYYYRASVIKRHLKYAHQGHGWVFTEFIHPVSWASKFQSIPDSAAHQILETRWLRDPRYSEDVVELYTRAGLETLSGISYTHYMHRAIYEHAQATGDAAFLLSQLDGMITTYNLWNTTIDSTTGLYHRTPLSDAQEYSLPGFLTGGPNGGPMTSWTDPLNDYITIWLGPETYRPDFNAYMVAGARTISTVASLAGKTALAQEWDRYATDLYSKMEGLLYNEDINFWIDVVEGTNLPCVGRELIGYYPYRLDVGTDEQMIRGLEAGLTPEEFVTEYGPTTLEQTNPYYTALKNTTYCCIWQGQSWPFSTSVYLGTLARLARNHLSTVANAQFFQQEFSTYTRTNYKNGVPYTAESHYPTIDMWSGDTTNHSENYFHSTYLDNVFTNLLGVIPTLDDRLELQPLVPSNWSYFAVENLPYHGSLISILWDQSGNHYSSGNHNAGLSIFQNGEMIHNQPTLTALNVTLANDTAAVEKLASQQRYENILSNTNSPWGLPSVTADYCLSPNSDQCVWAPYKMNDGLLWYDITPDNFWTNNQSTSPYGVIDITLPRAREMSSISLAILDDTAGGGVTTCPTEIMVTDVTSGLVIASRSPWTTCQGNALNTILFSHPTNDTSNSTTAATGTTVKTSQLQVSLLNKLDYTFSISEIQIWTPELSSLPGPNATITTNITTTLSKSPTFYPAADALLGTFIGSFVGHATGLNCTISPSPSPSKSSPDSLANLPIVHIHAGGWAELAGIIPPDYNPSIGDSANTATRTLTVAGGGTGALKVQVNWMGANQTVHFSGVGNQTIEVKVLRGRNVVTMYHDSGAPWVRGISLA